MNIPSLPTDNLYKFIAISGVVILIASLYITFTQITEATDNILDLKQKIEITKTKYRGPIDQEKDLLDKVASLKNDMSIKRNMPDLKDQSKKLELRFIKIQKDLKKLTLLSDELKVSQIKSETSLNRIRNLVDRLRENLLLMRLSMIVGVLMMVLGFTLWYQKVQKYQDIIIKNDALKPDNIRKLRRPR